jgi:hypothetical protein
MDWNAWHDGYDRPESGLADRLRSIQQQISDALDACESGPIRVISLCAGQGRDLIGALDDHPRKADVHGLLVELNSVNVDTGRQAAQAAGLSSLEFKTGDAADTDQYQDLAPADLVVVCGTFGNLSDVHLERLISFLPQLCQTGGTVVWTHNRRPPDRGPQICAWLGEYGFAEQWISAPADYFTVGRHSLSRPSQPLGLGSRKFEFP